MSRHTCIAAAVVTLVASAGCKPESARRADRAAKEALAERDQLHEAARKLAETPDLVQGTAKVLQEAGELAQAAQKFEARRVARIDALRAQHAVVASQPKLIGTMAENLPLTDAARGAINEKMMRLQAALQETTNLIEGLETVELDGWGARDSEVTAAMHRLDDVRKDAWRALGRAPHIGRSSS